MFIRTFVLKVINNDRKFSTNVTEYIFHTDLSQIEDNFSDAGTTSLNNRKT